MNKSKWWKFRVALIEITKVYGIDEDGLSLANDMSTLSDKVFYIIYEKNNNTLFKYEWQ